MLISASTDRMYCCGVHEIGHFCNEDDAEFDDQEFTADDAEDLLNEISGDTAEGIMFHIWFVKRKKFDDTFEKDYEFQELRELVQKIPNVVHIGKTINPNSGNRIDGYAWVNKKG